MKVTWLGEGGLLFDNGNVRVLVDPTCENIGTADVIVVTSNLKNRLDRAALASAIGKETVLLVSKSVYRELSADAGCEAVLMSPHSVWSCRGVTVYAVTAATNDTSAIGVMIDDSERTYYVSGSTLYNFDVIDDVLDLAPDGVDYAFLPISGKDGCMNAEDAVDFAYEVGAVKAVPVCHGNASAQEFDFEDVLLLDPMVETELD